MLVYKRKHLRVGFLFLSGMVLLGELVYVSMKFNQVFLPEQQGVVLDHVSDPIERGIGNVQAVVVKTAFETKVVAEKAALSVVVPVSTTINQAGDEVEYTVQSVRAGVGNLVLWMQTLRHDLGEQIHKVIDFLNVTRGQLRAQVRDTETFAYLAFQSGAKHVQTLFTFTGYHLHNKSKEKVYEAGYNILSLQNDAVYVNASFYSAILSSWAGFQSVTAVFFAPPDENFPPPSIIDRMEAYTQSLDFTPSFHKMEDVSFNSISPASGPAPLPQDEALNEIDVEFLEDAIDAETVIVPGKTVVISSSRDGKIKNIGFQNGDYFKQGDILVEYACDDYEAEKDLISSEKTFIEKKIASSTKLFKLGLISDIEQLELESMEEQQKAKQKALAYRMESCMIKAPFDGRVTNKLANENEFTRTDRVLIEIAAMDGMNAEFLIPSKALRWVNVGAPVNVYIKEMDKEYAAVLTRIHGEIDPVSESIQVVATLSGTSDYLIPGMSGTAQIDIAALRERNIQGLLETIRE